MLNAVFFLFSEESNFTPTCFENFCFQIECFLLRYLVSEKLSKHRRSKRRPVNTESYREERLKRARILLIGLVSLIYEAVAIQRVHARSILAAQRNKNVKGLRGSARVLPSKHETSSMSKASFWTSFSAAHYCILVILPECIACM